MKAFSGFKSEAKSSKPAMLPPGVYVAQIKAVKIMGNEPDQSLIIRVDIYEGEWAGYYTKRFKRDSENDSSKYPAKYKGDYKLRIPNEANKKAMYPESDIATFNDAIFRIEESNPGYHWDWNEQGLVGLFVGLNIQQSSYNGYPFTRIGRLEIVDEVRTGKAKPMAPKEERGDAWEPPIDQQSGFTVVDTSETPF